MQHLIFPRKTKLEVPDSDGFLQLDPTVRKGFEGVSVTLKVDADASAEDLQKLIEASPMRDIFINPVPVRAVVTVE